jgi:hypothetical protein
MHPKFNVFTQLQIMQIYTYDNKFSHHCKSQMSSAEAVKNTQQKCAKKKGRPPKVKCKDDFCRICNLDFKVQLGNSKIATENLFTCKESGREERKGLVLATTC